MKVGMIFQRKVWAINTSKFERLCIDEHRIIIQEIVLIQQHYPHPQGYFIVECNVINNKK